MNERPERQFDRARIRALLQELSNRLERQDTRATMYVVGGAAMALEYDSRRVTRDIDAVFEPRARVVAEAEAMAEHHGLPAHWLSDAVRAFVPDEPARVAVNLELGALSIAVAPPEHLLAMKMAAFRRSDIEDLVKLFTNLGIDSPDEAADIALGLYGPDSVVLPDREELVLSAEAVLSRMRDGR